MFFFSILKFILSFIKIIFRYGRIKREMVRFVIYYLFLVFELVV